jgi:hypothetical protein
MGEPFDPHKIPLIPVHVLLSSPVTWINLQNDLMGDPELRQYYSEIVVWATGSRGQMESWRTRALILMAPSQS